MRILCVGASHKTAPVAVREQLVFDQASARTALSELRCTNDQAEFIILSTCNRSELYVARPLHGQPKEEDLRDFFGTFHHLSPEQYDPYLYLHTDWEAVRHLFSVAAGLDSMVTGEDHILSQLKDAFRLSREQEACRGRLSELFHAAFTVAKEVRRETQICSGRVSVPSVAVEHAHSVLGGLEGKCALSVGAGKMNELMLRGLMRHGIGPILVANRSQQRGAELAQLCGGSTVPFEHLTLALAQADVVVCSTASPLPVITRSIVQQALLGRNGRQLLIIDIAVPRDVESGVADLDGVTLLNIDDVKIVVEKNISLRDCHVDACRGIIDRHVSRYFHRLHVREVVPALEALYLRMREIADEEMARISHKLTGQANADKEMYQRAIHRALRRILHKPILNLRSAAGTEIAREHANMLRKLFSLQASSDQVQIPPGHPFMLPIGPLLGSQHDIPPSPPAKPTEK